MSEVEELEARIEELEAEVFYLRRENMELTDTIKFMEAK